MITISDTGLSIILWIGCIGAFYCIGNDKHNIIWMIMNQVFRMSLIITAFNFATRDTSLFIFGCIFAITAVMVPYEPYELPENNQLMPQSNPTNQTQVDLREMVALKCVHRNTQVDVIEYTGENFEQIRQMMIDNYGIGSINEEHIRNPEGILLNKFIMVYGPPDKMIKINQYVVFEKEGLAVYTKEHFNENYEIVE